MREDATLNSRVHFDKPMLAHHKMKIETLKYICDITGQECEPVGPREHSATLQFSFGFGSKLDGAHAEFHLSAEAAEEVWALLSAKYPQLKLERA